MKIIKIDNYDSDSQSDVLVAENVNETYGRCMTEALIRNFSGDHAPDFFRLTPDSYKLYKWEP